MLTINEQSRGDVMMLTLTGRMAASASELEIRDRIRRVLVRGYRKLIVDLTGVTNPYAAEDGLLLGPLVDARGVGAEIKLIQQRATDLKRHFRVFESELEALDSFGIERPA
jgi:anti-anti-sigma regulatory factor